MAQASVAEARDLFEYRMIMEAACAEAAAERGDGKAAASLERFRSFASGQDFIQYNRDFHVALAKACGNRRMEAAVCDVIDEAEQLVRVSIANVGGGDPAQLVSEHAAIIDAIGAHDSALAGRLVREHLQRAQQRILSALERGAAT